MPRKFNSSIYEKYTCDWVSIADDGEEQRRKAPAFDMSVCSASSVEAPSADGPQICSPEPVGESLVLCSGRLEEAGKWLGRDKRATRYFSLATVGRPSETPAGTPLCTARKEECGEIKQKDATETDAAGVMSGASTTTCPESDEASEDLAPESVYDWGVAHVTRWALSTPVAPEAASVLREHEITGAVLVSLTESDLKNMGMSQLGRRRQLLLSRDNLVKEHAAGESQVRTPRQVSVSSASTQDAGTRVAVAQVQVQRNVSRGVSSPFVRQVAGLRNAVSPQPAPTSISLAHTPKRLPQFCFRSFRSVTPHSVPMVQAVPVERSNSSTSLCQTERACRVDQRFPEESPQRLQACPSTASIASTVPLVQCWVSSPCQFGTSQKCVASPPTSDVDGGMNRTVWAVPAPVSMSYVPPPVHAGVTSARPPARPVAAPASWAPPVSIRIPPRDSTPRPATASWAPPASVKFATPDPNPTLPRNACSTPVRSTHVRSTPVRSTSVRSTSVRSTSVRAPLPRCNSCRTPFERRLSKVVLARAHALQNALASAGFEGPKAATWNV